MFSNKEIDPRECLYRLNPKVRKQIYQIIKVNKRRYQNDEDEDGHQITSTKPKDDTVLTNRSNKKKNDSSKKEDEDQQRSSDQDQPSDLLQDYFSKEKVHSLVTDLETVLEQEDQQKQSFTYENLVRMHHLLQYLDEKHFRGQYFYEFLEDNCRLGQEPAKRKNAQLDDRLRKLKYYAANDEYHSMTANVGQIVCHHNRTSSSGHQRRSSSNKSGQSFNFSQEMKSIRSTLLATGNAFMVIGATFLFFYIASGLIKPDYTIANRVLFSFVASMIVAVAEIYFLIRII